MTPDCRRWTEQTIAAWSRRADQLFGDPEATTGELTRAEMLGLRVADLRQRLACAPPPEVAEIERLQQRLAKIMPYLHPEYQIMFNEGEVMDAQREHLAEQIRALGGTVPPLPRWVGPPRHRWVDAPQTAPEREPEPVIYTVQQDMFG
jgi:hypothetical protein